MPDCRVDAESQHHTHPCAPVTVYIPIQSWISGGTVSRQAVIHHSPCSLVWTLQDASHHLSFILVLLWPCLIGVVWYRGQLGEITYLCWSCWDIAGSYRSLSACWIQWPSWYLYPTLPLWMWCRYGVRSHVHVSGIVAILLKFSIILGLLMV